MRAPTGALLGTLLAATGCSDSTGPTSGTFQAQLSTPSVVTISGSSNASAVFIEEFPGPRFTIRMLAPQGEITRAFVIHCPGQDPPAPGGYAISIDGAELSCVANYSRVISNTEGGVTILEQVLASSGQVTISQSGSTHVAGSFRFTGSWVVGSESSGTASASGRFNAVLVQ